jgi:tetratricopeptide (TPR) repeat protein
MPPSVAREAVEWFEIIAMRNGTRDLDQNMVDSLYESDLAKARSMVADGRFISAARRLREMESTYTGLRDTSEAKRAADRVESTDEYRLQRKLVKKVRGYEDRCGERRDVQLSRLQVSDIPPPTQELSGKLYIMNLKQSSERNDEEGLAAQRCLNDLYAALSFYIPRDDLQQGRYAHVARSYELANMIRDDNPVVWYNLACVRAQLGQSGAAVEALASALERGFDRFELLRTDSDLDPLRDRDDFKALVAAIPDF